MSAYKVFLGSIVFFALFTGATTFQQSFFQGQNVDSNSTNVIDQQYDKLKANVQELRQNVRQVQSPDSSILDSAVAGLYLVPNFLTLILSPITIISSVLDALAAQYIFFPQFMATGIKFVIITVVSWSAFRLLIGLRG